MKVLVAQLCLTLCDTMDYGLCPWNSPDKNTGVSSQYYQEEGDRKPRWVERTIIIIPRMHLRSHVYVCVCVEETSQGAPENGACCQECNQA